MSKYTPHAYQQRGIDLLTEELGGAGLLLDPGMGKTSIALFSYMKLREKYPGIQMLVIVPIQPMYGTWPDEVAKWAECKQIKLSIIHGTPKQREAALTAEADIYLINPEGLKWLLDKRLHEAYPENWCILCVDESTKFKKSTTKRFKLLKDYLHMFHWRWIMTGTIAPNGLEDLFGQVYIMDRGKALGTYITHFRQQYFMQVGYRGYEWVPREGATEQVMQQIESRVLQLKAEDYLKMPDFIKVYRQVTLPPRAQEIYTEVEHEFISEHSDSTIVAVNSGAAAMKCRQISNGAVYDAEGDVLRIHEAKIEALDDIVEETNGHPLLIMYEFKHDRDRIQEHLGKDCICLTGMKPSDLKETIQNFNLGLVKYLLLHPASAHGMNIQKSCKHIVWFSIIWDLELFIQANTRLYRQGQTSPSVMCYLLAAKNTIDEVVSRALRRKELDQRAIENELRRYCGVQELI